MNTSQKNPLRLEIRGLGPVPSIKNHHKVGGLTRSKSQPRVWYGFPTIITQKEYKRRKRSIAAAIVSALSSECQTRGIGTTLECLKQFAIASLPQDDNWKVLEIGSVKTELVPKGQEGCVIMIEKLDGLEGR